MRTLVFGSLNIDKVYHVAVLPMQGQTVNSPAQAVHVGGKGLNQAVSLCRAGADVAMAGCVGADGEMLVDFLRAAGVHTDLIERVDGFSGQAVILVDAGGQNQMVICPGANHALTPAYCDRVLAHYTAGDLVLLQYETTQVMYMIEKAHEKGLRVAWNPSSFVPEICDLPLDHVDYLILNAYEGQCISGESDLEKVPDALLRRMHDGAAVVLTLGADGAVYADGATRVRVPAFSVRAEDTTCAGDTFTGYFLHTMLSGASAQTALRTASAASALAVMQTGAAETIPDRARVAEFLRKHG